MSFEDCAEALRASTGKAPNTMRISLGLASNFSDAYALMAFTESFRDVPCDQVSASSSLGSLGQTA